MTFRERGVAVPFTAPLLAGTRIRDSGSAGLELVVPNPSGGRGVYILHPARVRERYRPTVHDTVLLQRIAHLTLLDPSSMRGAAWDVAREGLAGSEARAAAETAFSTDRSQRLWAEFLLLTTLVEQVEPHGLKIRSFADRSAELDRRASAVLHRLGPSFGRSGPQLGDALAGLGAVFAPLGVAADDTKSRVARLIERLEDTRDDMARSFQVGEETDGTRLGRSVIASMDITLPCGRGMLTATRALLSDPIKLLSLWIVNPARVTALVTRAEWVLDGWEQICLLWRSAKTNMVRRAALLEMAQLVPALPCEAMEWSPTPLPREALDPACRVTCQNDGWRTGGGAFTLIGRNEKLRALSL
ncbi:hypothetical protein [Rhodopila sp.]|uniref:hypothetical protein n=1 Tax=Rhodopila sp. TaxID=2480087 RepID=UPI003D1128E8